MESPPSFSGWSDVHEAPVSIISVSEDSGLPLTSASSVSSGSLCGERVSCGFVESDGEDKSLSQYDSLDYSDGGMCGEHFNTLKKGPHLIHIEPPPEFQDSPPSPQEYGFVPGPNCISHSSLSIDKLEPCVCSQVSHLHNTSENTLANCSTPTREIRPNRLNTLRLWPQELAYSPAHSLVPHPRPVSRSSLGSSRLSSSHNSLSVPAANKADDSSFITQAISHDTLTGEISDMYNVPFDSDIYAVPVDMVRPVYDVTENRTPKPKRQGRGHRKRRRNTCATSQCELDRNECENNNSHNKNLLKSRPASHYKSQSGLDSTNGKRHSVPGTSGVTSEEPLHMTLEEVRNYLHTLYSSSSDSSDNKKYETAPKKHNLDCKTNVNNNKYTVEDNALDLVCRNYGNCANKKKTKKTFVINIKNKKVKDVSTTEITKDTQNIDIIKQNDKIKKSTAKNFSLSLKQTLCNIFRFRKLHSPGHLIKKQNFQSKLKDSLNGSVIVEEEDQGNNEKKKTDLCKRALPPLPKIKKDSRKPAPTIKTVPDELPPEDTSMDFTLSIEKVKDYGWYWGPMSGEAAERILSNEPDGSFIVRDSSDSHYIFSLTFKLLGCVRHVRIEHDQGNFSFGSCTKFKSHTIVEFIKNAVEHSRSGRYLFFLHRRPSANGPMRVQLLHPVSRFKQVQSLQHMCRFVILKAVRVDLIPSLPLPRRLIDYLNTKHYYSEQVSDSDSEDYGPHRVTETFGHQEQSINQVSDVLEPLALENIEQDSLIITDRDNIIPRLHIDERDRSVSTEDSERFRIHIIERESSIVTVDVSEREEMSALADVRENNSLNEMEGLRRGGRFRLGLRHERDRRFNNRISKSSVQEWEESNSS